MRSILVTILLVIVSAPLAAGDYHGDSRWVSKSLHSSCNWRGTCSWPYWKKTYRPRYSRHHFYGRPSNRYRHYRYLHRHRHTYRAYRKPDSEVMQAQLRLNDLGYDLEADGLWGPETAHAIRKFQQREGLESTGELGPRTRAMLLDRAPNNGLKFRHGDNGYSRHPGSHHGGYNGHGYGGDGDDNNRQCLPDVIRAYSDQHVWKEADEIARKRWMGAVRAEFGEVHMSWEFAADKKVRCWQSGEGSTIAEKAAESFGRAHTRCMAEARPCLVRRNASEEGH